MKAYLIKQLKKEPVAVGVLIATEIEGFALVYWFRPKQGAEAEIEVRLLF
jgi:hypothetical protein